MPSTPGRSAGSAARLLCVGAALGAVGAGRPGVAAGAEAAADRSVGELVVTGSRLPRIPGPSTLSLSTLGPEVLQRAADLGEALRGTADIYVEAPSSGSFGTLSLRGGDPNFTVVTIDGVPLNDSTTNRGGAVDTSGVGGGEFVGLEVLRGAQSSVYGSDALAGVVNLRLPDARQGAGGLVSGGAATDSRWTGLARGQQPLAGGAVFAALSANGQSRGPGGAHREGVAATLKLSAATTDAGMAPSAFVRASTGTFRAFPEDSGGALYARRRGLDHRRVDDIVAGARAGWGLAERWAAEVAVSGSDRRERLQSPGVAPGLRDPVGLPATTSRTTFSRLRAEAVLHGAPAEGLWLIAGVQAQREHGTTAGALTLFGQTLPIGFDLTRATTAAFAEAGLSLGRWRFEASARRDAPDDVADRTTARAAIAWATPDGRLEVRGSVADGFKAPSFYALGNPLVGNRDLAPETGRSWEAAATWRGGPLRLDLGGFHNRYRDLIDFDPGPPPRLVNRASVRSRGAFATLTAERADGARLDAGVTYAQTRDTVADAPLRGRPIWRASVSGVVPLGARLEGRAALDYVGARRDSSVPTGDVRLGGYSLVSLGATWRPRAGLDVQLDIENLLDRSYQERVGFPAEGRSGRIRLARRF